MDLQHKQGASAGSAYEREQVELSFRLPRYLRSELKEAARAQTVSMASLLRIIVLDFVRARHEAQQ